MKKKYTINDLGKDKWKCKIFGHKWLNGKNEVIKDDLFFCMRCGKLKK